MVYWCGFIPGHNRELQNPERFINGNITGYSLESGEAEPDAARVEEAEQLDVHVALVVELTAASQEIQLVLQLILKAANSTRIQPAS